jgi:hypothetical protein
MSEKTQTPETGGGSNGRTESTINTFINTTNILLPPYPVQPTEFKTEVNSDGGSNGKPVVEIDGNKFQKL